MLGSLVGSESAFYFRLFYIANFPTGIKIVGHTGNPVLKSLLLKTYSVCCPSPTEPDTPLPMPQLANNLTDLTMAITETSGLSNKAITIPVPATGTRRYAYHIPTALPSQIHGVSIAVPENTLFFTKSGIEIHSDDIR